MLKMKIADIEIPYKSVSDLTLRIESTLRTVRGKRTQLEQEVKNLRKKETLLCKFLGLRRRSKRKEEADYGTKVIDGQ